MAGVIIKNQNQTTELARKVAEIAKPGDAVLLNGEMGVGKTFFAKKFINSLGIDEDLVGSPTYTLVNIYETAKGPVWHADLYRVDSAEETLELGLKEGLADAICLIEWPERGSLLWPTNRLEINIDFYTTDQSRHVILNGFGTWKEKAKELMHAFS